MLFRTPLSIAYIECRRADEKTNVERMLLGSVATISTRLPGLEHRWGTMPRAGA